MQLREFVAAFLTALPVVHGQVVSLVEGPVVPRTVVAPGERRLILLSTDLRLPAVEADVPWPTVLEGLEVLIGWEGYQLPVAIGKIAPTPRGYALTIQIPPSWSGDIFDNSQFDSFSLLTLRYNGKPVGSYPVALFRDNVAFVDACSAGGNSYFFPPNIPDRFFRVCRPTRIVGHDGSNPSDPEQPGARPGDRLSLFVYGLGSTFPDSKAGEPFPPAAHMYPYTTPFSRFYDTDLSVRVAFDARRTALRRFRRDLTPAATIDYAGPQPGEVGVYRIDVTVPQIPGVGLGETCNVKGDSWWVTMLVEASTSIDAVEICVTPGPRRP